MKKRPGLFFVTIDALGPELLQKAHTPFIDNLADQGVLVKNAKTAFPTLTTPMMSSILTGYYPQKHGIFANTVLDTEQGMVKGTLRKLKVPAISDILAGEGYSMLSVQHFMLEGRKAVTHFQVQGSRSERIREIVVKSFSREDFDAVFCIYQAVDSLGHQYGPLHRKTVKALEEIDKELKTLWIFLRDRWGEFVTVLSSDHSMSLAWKHSNFSIKKLLKSLGLKGAFLNAGDKVSPDLDCVILRYPTVALHLLSAKAKTLRDRIIEALKNVKDVDRVYTKKELEAMGNGGYADIAYCLKDGFTTVPSILALHKFGYHGTYREESNVILFNGLKIARVTIENATVVDIIPTILSLLEIEPENSFDGKVLKELTK